MRPSLDLGLGAISHSELSVGSALCLTWIVSSSCAVLISPTAINYVSSFGKKGS